MGAKCLNLCIKRLSINNNPLKIEHNSMKLLILSFLLISTQLYGQDSSATALPFSKGVNLTNWFQASSPGSIDFSKYTYEDFSDIKSLGIDVIRLPINLHSMTLGDPDQTLDPLFLFFLD